MSSIISGIKNTLKGNNILKAGSSLGRIDTHHHIVPKFYKDMCDKAKVSSIDHVNPDWSVDTSLKAMDTMKIQTAILSLSAPGFELFSKSEGRDCARRANEMCAEIMDKHPDRFGFFAAIPCLTDIDSAIAELAHALDNLKADGVVLLSSYKDRYLGEEDFKPFWQELNKRKALVFIHPTYMSNIQRIKFMIQPRVDFPYQTTKTATHLVVTNRIKENPDVKIILSHAGGFLPYAADRIAIIQLDGEQKSPDDIHTQFKSFYYDTALSSSTSTMKALLDYADPNKITFGSDFPHATLEGSVHFTEQLDKYPFEDGQLDKINHQNALALFPRLTKVYKSS